MNWGFYWISPPTKSLRIPSAKMQTDEIGYFSRRVLTTRRRERKFDNRKWQNRKYSRMTCIWNLWYFWVMLRFSCKASKFYKSKSIYSKYAPQQERNPNFFNLCGEWSYRKFEKNMFKLQKPTFRIHGSKILPRHDFNTI